MTTFDEFLAGAVSDSVNSRQPCGPFCTIACRAADAELHGARSFLPEPYTANDEAAAVADMADRGRLDIADPGPAALFIGSHDHGLAGECPGVVHEHIEGGFVDDCDRYPGPDHSHELVAPPAVHSGDQGNADLRAVQLRPENFSPAMVEKAGRLLAERSFAELLAHPGEYDVRGDSGEVYRLRCWGERVWFVTCPCAARASRWNRAGACAHRVLAGFLRARTLRQPIPRWADLDLEEAS